MLLQQGQKEKNTRPQISNRMKSKSKTKKKETVAQKAFRLLSAVPANEFITGDFTDGKGKCCSTGHYMRLISKNPNNYSIQNCKDGIGIWNCSTLRIKSIEFLNPFASPGPMWGANIATVNNKRIFKYKQKKIKSRVIALLKDMVRAGY